MSGVMVNCANCNELKCLIECHECGDAPDWEVGGIAGWMPGFCPGCQAAAILLSSEAVGLAPLKQEGGSYCYCGA